MKKVRQVIASMFAMIALVVGISFVGATPAAAAIGRVYIYNNSNTPVRLYCSYGSSTYKLLYKYQSSQMSGKCTANINDTDQIMALTTLCIRYRGPRVADGYYKLNASAKVKIHDLANVQIYNYGSKCSGKPYYRHF